MSLFQFCVDKYEELDYTRILAGTGRTRFERDGCRFCIWGVFLRGWTRRTANNSLIFPSHCELAVMVCRHMRTCLLVAMGYIDTPLLATSVSLPAR